MSRRIMRPTESLPENLRRPDFSKGPPGLENQVKDAIRAELVGQGCKPAGSDLFEAGNKKRLSDPDWEKDLTSLVERSKPHSRTYSASTAADGTPIPARTVTQRIKLETLQAEIDDLDEVCAWIYELEELP